MVKPIKKLTIYAGYGIDDPYDKDLVNGIFISTKTEQDSFYRLFNNDSRFNKVAFTRNEMYYAHFIYDITEALKVSLEVMQVNTGYQNAPVNHGHVLSTDLAFWLYF
jgi:hypothetical protein